MSKKLFDFCLGNPPYNDDFNLSGENSNYAPAVYNMFMDEAFKIADSIELIHPARFLFNAGSTPKAWNEKMLNDEHFKVLDYEPDGSKVFSNTSIPGGVAITLYNNSANFGAIETFTPFEELNKILKKVTSKSESDKFNKMLVLQSKFDLENLYYDHPEYKSVIGSDGKDKRFRNNIFDKLSVFSESKESSSDAKIYGISGNKRTTRFIPTKYMDQGQVTLDSWKVLVPSNNGSPAIGEKQTAVIGEPFIVEPFAGYTQTFIGIGPLSTEAEAEAIRKYIASKFVRCMIGVLKVTPNNPPEKWKYVPMQDFTSNSDINWNTSIKNIDKQLYKKYGLSNEEIQFIETNVKEMK